MSQKRQHKSYSAEFKQEAVGLVTEQGYSVAEAARSLGIRSNLLYRWKQQLEEAKSGMGLSTDERAELQTLRKENKRLRMEKAILKNRPLFSPAP